MKKLLYISAFKPSNNSQAGQKTSLSILRNKSSNAEIDLIVISKIKLRSFNYDFVKSTTIFSLNYLDYIFIFLSLLLFFPPRLSSRFSIKALIHIRKIITQYDEVWLDNTQVFWIGIFLKSRKINLICHDLFFDYATKSNFIDYMFKNIYKFWEKKFFSLSSQINVQSNRDFNLVRNLCTDFEFKTRIIMPAISEFAINPKIDKSIKEKHSILFWGALDRSENYQAICDFINTFYKKLQSEFPALKLYIVGLNPHKSIIKLAKLHQGIVVTGYIDNPTIYFNKSSIGICPLKRGAGIKVKVLEMLAFDLPVFTTNVGSEGIVNREKIYEVDYKNFYKEILNYWNSATN